MCTSGKELNFGLKEDIALVSIAFSLNAAGTVFIASVISVMMALCVFYKFCEEEIALLVDF